ncbi:Uma2 family endonuclease [Streptomyces sp. NPDC047108]|uniref:Uma2 family endonuclease n=1 Tax=Streptomyces sp. NPDC047108 TaxID=3155025 RepID=UPI0033D54CF8
MPAMEHFGQAEGDTVLAAFLELTVPEGYRAELIEGEIIVTPPPDGDHEDVVGRLIGQISRHSAADLYAAGTKGLITPLGRFIPDAAIGPTGTFRGMDAWAEPNGVVMTVEVNSTRPDRDRGPKRRGYAAAGIPFYLLVDRSDGTVTLHAEPHDGDYKQSTRVPFGKSLDLPDPFSFALDTAVFA